MDGGGAKEPKIMFNEIVKIDDLSYHLQFHIDQQPMVELISIDPA